jgi:DNA-binding response OmpR family regulator
VDVGADGKSGLDLATTYQYDLVILDLMLPALDGSQVLRRLRTENVQVPLLILTARDAFANKVGNFEAGANDYMTFASCVLNRRKKAIWEPSSGRADTVTEPAQHFPTRSTSVRWQNDGAGHSNRSADLSRPIYGVRPLFREITG